MSRQILVFFSLAIWTLAGDDPAPRVPTVEDLLKIRTLGSVEISPDGKWVVYSVSQADFDENAYVSQLWVSRVDEGKPHQLTRNESGSSDPAWSPDGRFISFRRESEGKSQLFLIRPDGGEAQRITAAENGVSGYRWSPHGGSIAFLSRDGHSEEGKKREERYGDFEVVRRDYSYSHLWLLKLSEALETPQKGERLTEGDDFSVRGFSWSPNSKQIAFDATLNPDLIQGHTSDIRILEVDSKRIRTLVDQPGPDGGPVWSPDGSEIAFATAMGERFYYSKNRQLAVVSSSGGEIRSLTADFDENAFPLAWKDDGIYFGALRKTFSHLFRLDVENGRIERVSDPEYLIASGFSLSEGGGRVAFRSASPKEMSEVYVTDLPGFSPRKLTDFTAQTNSLVLGTREIISWQSRDGTTIEGVLVKPADFDPSRRYPLLCIIHGGPTGIDRPILLERGIRYYPVDTWVGRGALVLRVNYRGSAGYGEAFRRLNRRNLGVGDAWDVLSGVDHLIEKGWVDPDRVGCMGWSQGGYISAFLTTSSDRFAAISVGAGISNWATYYYNTDITPFTIDYLGDDPVDDPDIYSKTSPMTYIKGARTPTLIQHGEFDRRVPIPNAYELRQGLEDRGVAVEMIVYKGFGHGINKPKSMRAVLEHNLAWFNHYLWGDPLKIH